MHINQYARNIHEQNKAVGWWDDNPCIYEKLQLISTEVAEATEGERKNLMDDHLPHRKMGEVELADALIRTLDLGGKFEWSFREGVDPHPFIAKGSSIGKQHIGLNMALCNLVQAVTMNVGAAEQHTHHLEWAYAGLVTSFLYCSSINGYDIYAAMDQKLIYNTKRADHKRENRNKEGGKKF